MLDDIKAIHRRNLAFAAAMPDVGSVGVRRGGTARRATGARRGRFATMMRAG